MTMLNVKEKIINNNRLSRLQGIILKVLAYVQVVGGYGCYKRPLCKTVAGLYGNSSLIYAGGRELEHIAEGDHPFTIIDKLKSSVATVEGYVTGKAWISPKFSVSFSRALRLVCHKGLVQTYEDEPIFTITEKGISEIRDRKVKVHAQSWELFTIGVLQKRGINGL